MKKIFLLLAALCAISFIACQPDSPESDHDSGNETIDPNEDITAQFDKDFAARLESHGYIEDADHITRADVMDITELDISYCNLTSLKGIEYFEALTHLDCWHNELTSLDISKNTALTILDCRSNQLTSLDISKNIVLTHLDCWHNELTSLDVSKNTALTYLDCRYNQLTSLDISNNTALTKFYCAGNPGNGTIFPVTAWFDNGSIPDDFTIYNWDYNGNIITISYIKSRSGSEITDPNEDITAQFDEDFAAELESRGYIEDANHITRADVMYFPHLNIDGEAEYIPGSGLVVVDGLTSLKGIEYFEALTQLFCQRNYLTSLDLSKNTALTILDCSVNQLTSLDLSKNTALEDLDCNDNQLTSLDLSKNTALTILNCYINQLTSLDISKNTALEDLDCNDNQLTSLDLSKNTALTILNCYINQLTSLDISNNTALTNLNSFRNQLTSLDVSKNTALENLFCQENQLTSLDISDNTVLTLLNCTENQLTSLDISKNTALENLFCQENQLTSLDISNNTALTKFYCAGNPGNGTIFPVTAWFDNGSIPDDFTKYNWDYNGNTITISYIKKETE